MGLRILVLGGDNFITRRVRGLLSQGNWATPVDCDAPPGRLDTAHLEGIHAVFNGTLGTPPVIRKTAQALAVALQRTDPGMRVVHLSSMTVYGSQSGRVTEDAPLRPDLGAYGAAQIDAEQLLSRHPGTVILRPGCEYGPDSPQWSLRIARLLSAHRLGDLGAHGDGVCNLVYADDVAMAVMAGLQRPGLEGRRFNLAMSAPPTWNHYLTSFARALGAVPVARIGARRLQIESRLLAPPLKLLEVLDGRLLAGRLGTPPPVTPSLVALCGQTLTLDSSRAERELPLAWTSLDQGLEVTLSHSAAQQRLERCARQREGRQRRHGDGER